jgi:hypothetical protein
MSTITTIKELKDALANYPDDYQVIGICESIDYNYIRSLAVEQAKGSIDDGQTFDMPLVNIVLEKNAVVAMTGDNQQVILQKLEH